MSPAWISALRDVGPFGPAVQRFLERERAGDAASMPRGASALAWLARVIDRFAMRDAGAQEEGVFVEGAGALLALVLLDHVGEGGHASRDGAHRMRLGQRGFFDPFAAIEAAMDAGFAKDALVAEVARAELEARGTGGVGRAAMVFERILGEKRPELEVYDRFDRQVWVGEGIEVDLGRAIDASEGQGERALEQSLAKLVSMLPGGEGAGAIDRDEALARMLPRIVAGDLGVEGLLLRPMANDVRIALVLAYEGRSRFVRASELEAWGLAQEDAIRHAITRLAARSAKARFAHAETDAGLLVVARAGDGLDSARLLLPGLHEALSPELGSPFLVAIPHRDTLLACAREPSIRAALSARAKDEAMRAPHRITDALFEVWEGGIRAA